MYVLVTNVATTVTNEAILVTNVVINYWVTNIVITVTNVAITVTNMVIIVTNVAITVTNIVIIVTNVAITVTNMAIIDFTVTSVYHLNIVWKDTDHSIKDIQQFTLNIMTILHEVWLIIIVILNKEKQTLRFLSQYKTFFFNCPLWETFQWQREGH